MNSADYFPESAQTCSSLVLLMLQGIGHVPSFKNTKMLTRGKLITSPQKQRWMRKAQVIIESQLLSAYPTAEKGTVTAEKLRSWIASSVPANDSCRYLTACSWRFTSAPKGREAALILIECL